MRKILVHVNFYKFDVTMAREGKEYTGPAAWQLPRTLEEYEELPSTKIDLAVKIITHHLAMTGAAPLVNACPNGDRLGPDSSEWDAYTNDLIPSVEAFRSHVSAPPTAAPSARQSPLGDPEVDNEPAVSAVGQPWRDDSDEDEDYIDEDPSSSEYDEETDEDDEAVELNDEDETAGAEEYTPLWNTSVPDKIVVYSFFTQQQQLLKKVKPPPHSRRPSCAHP